MDVDDALFSDRNLPSILQFSSEDQMTKWQICQTFSDIMGLPLEGMEPFTPNEDPTAGTVRPYDCHLDTSALRLLGIDVSTVDFRTWWYVSHYQAVHIPTNLTSQAQRSWRISVKADEQAFHSKPPIVNDFFSCFMASCLHQYQPLVGLLRDGAVTKATICRGDIPSAPNPALRRWYFEARRPITHEPEKPLGSMWPCMNLRISSCF